MQIGRVKDLVELLRKAPQDDVLMTETDCEDFLEQSEILLDVDDVLVGSGTLKGITFLKIIGLRQFAQEIRNTAITEFMREIRDWQIDIRDNERDADKFDFVFERIYEIAEEMKESTK